MLSMILITVPPPIAEAASRAGRRRALDSVVQVQVTTRFDTTRRCSGYLFSPSGQVLTSFHAVSDATAIKVMHPAYGVFQVDRIRRINPRADVAVLSIVGAEGADLVSAYVGDSRNATPGDDVFVLHHSHGAADVIYTTTIISTGYPQQYDSGFPVEDFASEMMLFEVEGPFDAGSAGGLLCNEDFEVIGLLLGGGRSTKNGRIAYALASFYFRPLMIGTADVSWSRLNTEYDSEEAYFDEFLGPSVQQMDYQAPMAESYIAWFAPVHHSNYADAEFTAEINDNIDKSWFTTVNLTIDGRDLNEWSASRIFVWPANLNPWDITDGPDRYVYFDADSLFSKRIYKDRDTEERIITRHILVMPLPPGRHSIRYENRGANYKSTGMRTQRLDLSPAEVKMIDIQGLNFVSWQLLPSAVPRAGEGEPVHYEVDKRPLGGLEINTCIRRIRYPVDV
jgi:hypothetical protein